MASKQDSNSGINSIIDTLIEYKDNERVVHYFVQGLVIALKTSDSTKSNEEHESLVKSIFSEKGEELNDDGYIMTQLKSVLVQFDNGEMSIIVPTSGGKRKRRKKTRRKTTKRKRKRKTRKK